MKTVAELTDITKAYGDKVVVDSVNLQIREGEILALLGPNGSGKSTILKMLAFIENPTSGEVIFQNEKVNFKNTEKERLQSTLVFQKTTVFGTSVYNNVAYGLKLRKVPKETRDREVKKALELVKLEGFEKRNARKLSGYAQHVSS
jgi:tungstate transport system ATP-binding protein